LIYDLQLHHACVCLEHNPNTLLPTFYQLYTLVLNNLPCDTHLYSFKRYVNYTDNHFTKHVVVRTL
jgi:hypothetical protein